LFAFLAGAQDAWIGMAQPAWRSFLRRDFLTSHHRCAKTREIKGSKSVIVGSIGSNKRNKIKNFSKIVAIRAKKLIKW